MRARGATAAGARLYRWVEAYAALGDHWTGTAVDEATCGWAVRALEDLGARVRTQPFRFSRFEAEAALAVAGRRIACVPLFYAGPAALSASDVPSVRVYMKPRDEAAALAQVKQAMAAVSGPAGAGALIVVTESATGGLYALNVDVKNAAEGPAIVVVGANDVAGLDIARNSLVFRCRVGEGGSANVIADFGRQADVPALVISTPLTGWTAAAGERGSGIAVAFEVARRVGADVPVRLVLSSGHELGHIGLDHYLAASAGPADERVLHVGACVAAGSKGADGCFRITPDIRLTAHADPQGLKRMEQAMARAGIAFAKADPPAAPASWRGEARNWAPRVHALASLVGFAPHFHEPGDVPENVTDGALLETVADALTEVAQALVHAPRR